MVGTRLQLVEVTAVKIKFPATRVFSFEITYFTGDDDQVVDVSCSLPAVRDLM